jgi:hypothetical protein
MRSEPFAGREPGTSAPEAWPVAGPPEARAGILGRQRAVVSGSALGVLCIILLGAASLGSGARAAERVETGAADSAARPSLYSLQRQRFQDLPGMGDPGVRALWNEALRLESENQLLGSARVFERISRRLPADATAYWRVARNYWRYGDDQRARSARVKYFTLAEKWAGAALAIDPRCGPCYLHKFLAMASLATTQGIFTAIRHAGAMQRLLDRGIELQPTQADNEWNSTLGNLYAAASHFYRVTPESFWLELVVGVRGDRERALDYARRAHALAAERIDYTVALGAALLCLGREKNEPQLIGEGIATLRRVPALPHLRADEDPRYECQAAALIAHPETACSYTPDGPVDVDGALAKGDGRGGAMTGR